MEDLRENPGTLALAGSWVLVFALILLVQSRTPGLATPGPKWEPLPVSTVTSHRFGDMTWLEVRQGQYWRLLTATFIHFGLIHVALNAVGLLNLGRLVEPWYRTGPFLAICLAMGGLGNLVGGALRQLMSAARPWLASVALARHWPGPIERFFQGGPALPVSIHTGGGSTILLGLLALGAVVGWRSKTRIGGHLQKQMLILLGLTAVLGVAMSGLVDNYGHLGGAIVGGAIGLLDRPLFRLSDFRWFRVFCWLIVLGVSAACMGSAIRADRQEHDYRAQLEQVISRGQVADGARVTLGKLHALYASMVYRWEHHPEGSAIGLDIISINNLLSKGPRIGEPPKPDPAQVARERAEMVRVLDQLDHTMTYVWGDQVVADFIHLGDLGRMSLQRPPSYKQIYDFVVTWRSVEKVVNADIARLNARLIELEASRKPGRPLAD